MATEQDNRGPRTDNAGMTPVARDGDTGNAGAPSGNGNASSNDDTSTSPASTADSGNGAQHDGSGDNSGDTGATASDGNQGTTANGGDGGTPTTAGSGGTSASGGDGHGTTAAGDDGGAISASGGDNNGASANGGDTSGTNTGGTTADNGSGTGTETSSGNGDGSDNGTGLGLPVVGDLGSGLGLGNGLGGGLVHDALADTRSLVGTTLGDLQSSGSNLITDVVNGADHLLGDTADNLGLGNVIGDHILGDTIGNLTGGIGNGLVPDAVADTQSLVGTTLGDLSGNSGNLVNDVVHGADQLVDHAVGNLGLGDSGGVGSIGNGTVGGIAGGLIPDAVNDTQTLANDALGNLGSGQGLANGVATDADHLVDHAVGNLGLGDTGTGALGGLTGDLGNGINVADILGDGPLVNGNVLNGDGAIANPVSALTGGLTDGLLGSSTGDGPLAYLGVVSGDSPAVSDLAGNIGDGALSGLSIGQILNVTGLNDANGNSAVSATAGNNPGDSGPIVNAHAFGDNSSSSNNLINLGAGQDGGTSGSSSDIIANVLGGRADSSNPAVDANLIATAGQTLANADVLTAPDHFQFPVLDGAGTDALSGVLGTDVASVAPSIVPDVTPLAGHTGTTGDLVDVNLGDANPQHHGVAIDHVLGIS